MRPGTAPRRVPQNPAPSLFQRLLSITLAIPLPLDSPQSEEQGEKDMAEPNVDRELMGSEEGACEVRLWQAVVVRTIQDWMSGPLRQKRQAESYLFDRNTDFAR